jgi:hypothetical protein
LITEALGAAWAEAGDLPLVRNILETEGEAGGGPATIASRAEEAAVARAEATQLNARNVQGVKRTISPATGNETFVHTTMRADAPQSPGSAALNISESMRINLSPGGARGQWGQGVYAYERSLPAAGSPTDMVQVQFSVPKGTAIERIEIPNKPTVVRLVPPEGDTLTIVNPITNLSAEEVQEAAKLLRMLKSLID